MKVVLTGATGFVGSQVLQLAIDDHDISKIISLVRRPTGKIHPKLNEIIMINFCDYTNILSELANIDACIWCMGSIPISMERESYAKMTYDYTMEAAKVLLTQNPNFHFCYLSAQGITQDETRLINIDRVKGRTERELSKLVKDTYIFHPGYIQPSIPRKKPIFSDYVIGPLVPFINKFTDAFSVPSQQLAYALLHVAKQGIDMQILENKTIRNIRIMKT